MAFKLTSPKFRMRVFGVAAALLFVMTSIAAYMNNLEERHSVRHVGLSGQLSTMSQQLAKNAQQASSGNATSFDALAESKASLTEALTKLEVGEGTPSAIAGETRAALDALLKITNKALQDIQVLESGRAGVIAFGNAVVAINKVSVEFNGLAQTMIETYRGAQREQALRFALALERIAKNANLVTEMEITIEQLAGFGMDILAAEESLYALPAEDANVVRVKKLFDLYRSNVQILVSQARNLVEAKKTAREIIDGSKAMLAESQRLAETSDPASVGQAAMLAAPLFGLLLLSLLLLLKAYMDNSRQRTEDALRINRQNQDGILRLMNELNDLAAGDLTVRATVSEDITGAIADSVNYTADEFRKLVSRIKAAAEQMERAIVSAQDTSRGLLEATQKQAEEIQRADDAVQLMAQSIKEVDSSAAKSADVARRTLVATQQGAQAVRNTISGMDGIREQIQDTAKRIKRLGESSQEIGEIVDLISDITEQTNVLALNAAIQAASAGEAGRGFSVVAEEVQRLAERSAEATRQIGGIVKTIQGDTHDAVAAMEKSILGVVEGAVLSDTAGQSLKEIEQVSNELATLINSISVSTQVQTDMASEVADVMQDILKITEQTTDGTSLAAKSTAQLTSLTSDLRNSVAGFKL